MNKQKLQLCHDLQEFLESKQHTIRQSQDLEKKRLECVDVLEEIESFLVAWAEFEDSSGLPDLQLKQTLSWIVSVLGPGDPQLRDHLWDTLVASGASTVCRLVVLDFLPATIPLGTNEDERLELIRILKQVFNDDSNLVGPVLECLDSIYEAGGLEKRDIIQFTLDTLPKEHESRIHLIIRFLVKHSLNDKNDRTVVEAIRAELHAVEETQSAEAFVLPTCQLLCELWIAKESNGFFNTYLDVLAGMNLDREENSRVLVVDMVVLLLANTQSKYHSTVQGIIDSDLLENYVASELPCLLLHDGIWKELSTPLLRESLVSLCITALSMPLRTRQMNSLKKQLETTKRFICLVFRAIRDSDDASTMLTVSMIKLADEIIEASGLGADNVKAAHAICTCIFGMLRTAVSDGLGVLACSTSFLRKHLQRTLSNAQHNDATLDQICAILCKLEERDGRKMETTAVFQLLQSLLFNPTPSVPFSEIQTLHKCRAGFLLASSIIVNVADIDENAISNIWKIMKSVLLPPNKNIVNPSIGLLGLDVAKKLSTSPTTSTTLKRQIFHTITHMVSKTKLIQYAANFEERRGRHVALAYADHKGVLESPRKSSKARKIIFCFDPILQDDSLLDSSSWRGVSEYVLTLIDTYLAIGRQPKDSTQSQSWTPRPWIEGAIELPLIEMTQLKIPTKKKNQLCDQLKEEMSKSSANHLHSLNQKNAEKGLVDLAKSIKADVDTKEIIHSILRLTLSLIVSQAISVAVVNNTFEQYEGVLNKQKDGVPSEKRNEALQLIHYQLDKLYDLRNRTKIMQKLLEALISRKSGKRNGPKRKSLKISRLSNSEMAESAVDQVGLILYSLFCHVRPEMLWDAVTDPFHDIKLIERLDAKTRNLAIPTSDSQTSLLQVVEMRLKVLDHLSLHFDHMRKATSTGVHQNSLQLIFGKGPHPVIARCLRLASFMSLRLAVLDDNFDSLLVERLAQLTASYFSLLSSSTSLLLEMQKGQIDPQSISFWSLLEVFSSFLGSKTPLQNSIAIEDDQYMCPTRSIKPLISSCRSHLNFCRSNLVRYELLESLSVFCIELGDDAIAAMLNVSSDFLHSRLKASSVRNHPPYSLRLATQRLIATVGDKAIEEKEFVQSLLGFDSRTGLLKSATRDPSTTFGMLRHWGLLALSPRQSAQLESYIHRLLSNVTAFLGKAPNPIANQGRTDPNEAGGEDGEYMQSTEQNTKRVEVSAKSSLPGLSNNSFVVYFELTLQIIIASTSVFSVSSEWKANEAKHPFDHLTKLLEVYGSSIELYLQKHHAFPVQTLQVIVKSSRDMLKSAITKMHSCMRWRNLQPVVLVHEVREKDDVASPRHLKRLIDAIICNVIAKIQSICKELPRLETFKGHGSLLKLKSLRAQAERIHAELLKTSSVLHLSDPEYDQNSDTGLVVAKKDLNTKVASTDDLSSENHSSRKRLRPMISLPPGFDKMQRDGISLSSEQSEDTSYSSNGSRSFGASGNWGEYSDEMSESGDEIMLKSKWIQAVGGQEFK